MNSTRSYVHQLGVALSGRDFLGLVETELPPGITQQPPVFRGSSFFQVNHLCNVVGKKHTNSLGKLKYHINLVIPHSFAPLYPHSGEFCP